MQVSSFEADTAMLVADLKCPVTTLVIGPRWLESVRQGDVWDDVDRPFPAGPENERRELIDQTWMLESSEPDKTKFNVKSTARAVTGCR